MRSVKHIAGMPPAIFISRKGLKGHLWQRRFASFPIKEQYLITIARYIELNPVEAGIGRRPKDYQWSSTKAHLQGKEDVLVKAGPLLGIIDDWQGLLARDLSEEECQTLRRHERSGRPLESDEFLSRLEKLTSRVLKKQKPVPKKKN